MVNKWSLIGKIKSSDWRRRVLNSLFYNAKTPNELVKEVDISSSHISEVLKDLEELRLIECKTPDLRKGKIYSLTKIGKEILKEFK